MVKVAEPEHCGRLVAIRVRRVHAALHDLLARGDGPAEFHAEARKRFNKNVAAEERAHLRQRRPEQGKSL